MQPLVAARILTLLVLVIFSSSLAAQSPAASGQGAAVSLKLPPRLVGKTESVGRAAVNVSWTLDVDEVLADGTVRGRMTYPGTTCGAKDAAFAGKYDGTIFTIDPVPFTGTSFCKGWVFRFTRQGDTNRFESIHQTQTTGGYPMTLKITLDPSQ
jgi:hypothetical protein